MLGADVMDRIAYHARNNNLNINLMQAYAHAFSGGNSFFIEQVGDLVTSVTMPDYYLSHCRIGLYAISGKHAEENQFIIGGCGIICGSLVHLFDAETNIKFSVRCMRHLMYITRKDWRKCISLISSYDEVYVSEKLEDAASRISVKLPQRGYYNDRNVSIAV
jgi:hypothetical protein